MPPPSLGRSFFDQIVNDPSPVDAIRRLINSDPPTTESDHFDCKLEPQDHPRQRDKKVKEIWSEVLAGFANGGGGVVIWGLDARKKMVEGREIDAVVDEKPVTNPRGLEARLRELQRQATDPPLGNVEIKSYPLPEDESKGFVVAYIPDGPYKPYRSEQAGQQYYMRAGDNTQVMPKAVLAAMFHPRSQAVFRARASLEFKMSPRVGSLAQRRGYPATGVDEIICRMKLVNDGTATAREMLVRVTWRIPGTKASFKEIGGSCWSNQDTEYAFQRGHPLHPGFEAAVFVASWHVENSVTDQNVNRGFVPGDIPPQIEMAIFCENQEPQVITVPFRLDELVTKEKLEVEATADRWSDG